MLQKILITLVIFIVCTASANEEFFKEAGKYYEINHILLIAIAQTESGQNPNAINCANKNGSCDYGIMQINSTHLPMLNRYGITKRDLFDERTNIFLGAWVLKGCLNKHGISFRSLNCYNGKIQNNDYYAKVLKNYWNFTEDSKNRQYY